MEQSLHDVSLGNDEREIAKLPSETAEVGEPQPLETLTLKSLAQNAVRHGRNVLGEPAPPTGEGEEEEGERLEKNERNLGVPVSGHPSSDTSPSVRRELSILRNDPSQTSMENLYVGISGMIGAGKTTLARSIGKKLSLPVYEEEQAVKFGGLLTEFYGDMKRYGFLLQAHLLNQRFAQQQTIIWSNKGGVQDRTIYEDAVFARTLKNSGNMTQDEYDVYMALFRNMSKFMTRPNLIVHLDVTPEQSLERIRMRGREMEKGITIEYLTALHDAYEAFIKDISATIPVIRVNYNTYPTIEQMADLIVTEYQKMSHVVSVEFAPRS